MRRYGLIGRDLKHSFSASYFKRKFEAQAYTEEEYQNYELVDIGSILPLLSQHDLVGLNVTIPYKQEVIPYLSALTPLAQRIGAVNTIAPITNGWVGHNTDYIGFTDSLLAATGSSLGSLKSKPALILGNGGAAQAVKVGLTDLGFTWQVVVRQIKQADNQILFDDLRGQLANFGLVVNTTPLGTHPDVDLLPPIPFEEIGPGHHVFDLIYNPDETRLLKEARLRGASGQNGYDMLVRQAEAAYLFWQSPSF